MKLFFREHILLIIVQMIQFSALFLIYWLDGYRESKLMLYGGFLASFFLLCYLIYHYCSRSIFYKRLSEPLENEQDVLQEIDHAPISIALGDLLKKQYGLYQQKMNALEHQQAEHLKFMDQWVHQMKTPLSVIELTAQTMDEPDSSNLREETERMKTGLNTILYMARLRMIERDFHFKQVKLSKIINDVNQENKRFYIRNKVYPKLLETRLNITVETDEKWLFFIILQIVNNAVKYSTGKSEQIIISLLEKDGMAILEVKDFGVGISKADQKRIFDAFYTGENGRSFRESTGMGLYLANEAAVNLNHQIECISKVGKGSTFRLIFPASQNITNM